MVRHVPCKTSHWLLISIGLDLLRSIERGTSRGEGGNLPSSRFCFHLLTQNCHDCDELQRALDRPKNKSYSHPLTFDRNKLVVWVVWKALRPPRSSDETKKKGLKQARNIKPLGLLIPPVVHAFTCIDITPFKS